MLFGLWGWACRSVWVVEEVQGRNELGTKRPTGYLRMANCKPGTNDGVMTS